MKTLIILAHPNIANSLVNRHWRDAVLAHPDKFELHDLYALYADFKIDVEKEQKLLESHDKIVLQFPFRFSNCTPLLKQWFEDVFTRSWAYGGESGGKLKGKKFALAISLGATRENYDKTASWALAWMRCSRLLRLRFVSSARRRCRISSHTAFLTIAASAPWKTARKTISNI